MRLHHWLAVAALAVGGGLALGPAQADVSIGISIGTPPPELPVYDQPPVPGPGYIWSPGYWAWSPDEDDYYWVPGTWVMPPQPGYLWTPGYWEFADGDYRWHGGYWGPVVGFYGGVSYGYGYFGRGYEGGHWDHGAFYYNRSCNNIPSDVHITNVYNQTVVNNVTVNRVSYNGGNGVNARPTPQELAIEHEHHAPPVSAQLRNEQAARTNPQLHAAANHGAPPVAATRHAASFTGPGVVSAHGAAANAPRPEGTPPHPAATTAPHAAATTAPHPGPAPPPPHPPARPAPPEHGPPAAQPQVHAFRPQAPQGGGAVAPRPPTPPPPPHVEERRAPAPVAAPRTERGRPPPERGVPERGNERDRGNER